MRSTCVFGLSVIALLSGIAAAQTCTTGFQPGEPGASGIYDPFSAYVGPLAIFQNKLFLSGAFSSAGGISTNVIAAFDPAAQTWSALGGGVNLGSTNGFGAGLASFTIGGVPNLILGGAFANVINTGSGAVADTAGLAAWDGANWSSLFPNWQPATGKSVWTVLDWEQTPGQHRLLAGGGFGTIGAATAYGLAIYDGEGWSNIAGPGDLGVGGPFSPVAFASAVYGGKLYVAGRFYTVNGVSSQLVARWSGTAWERPGTNLTAGSSTSDCFTLYVWDDGTGPKLYAGGYDMRVGGISTSAASFDGSTWRAVGQNLGGRTTCFAAFNDGTGMRLYAGWTADAQEHYLYRLVNNSWNVVDGGVATAMTGNFPSIFGLLATSDALYVGGDFESAGGEIANGIAKYAPCPCPADVNGDRTVNLSDLAALLANFGLTPATHADGDINGDGIVNLSDLAYLLSVFGINCG